jgi:hypothetical protein
MGVQGPDLSAALVRARRLAVSYEEQGATVIRSAATRPPRSLGLESVTDACHHAVRVQPLARPAPVGDMTEVASIAPSRPNVSPDIPTGRAFDRRELGVVSGVPQPHPAVRGGGEHRAVRAQRKSDMMWSDEQRNRIERLSRASRKQRTFNPPIVSTRHNSFGGFSLSGAVNGSMAALRPRPRCEARVSVSPGWLQQLARQFYEFVDEQAVQIDARSPRNRCPPSSRSSWIYRYVATSHPQGAGWSSRGSFLRVALNAKIGPLVRSGP